MKEQQNNTQSIENNNQPEINLDNLRNGKITIKDIPRAEVAKLWREEYQTLEEGAKETADATGWKPKHFFMGLKKDGSPAEWKDWKEFGEEIKTKLPLNNERLKHLSKENLEKDSRIEKLERQIAQLTAAQKMQLERDLKKDKSQIVNELQEAENDRDIGRYKAAQERKAEIEMEEQTLKNFDNNIANQNQSAPLTPEVITFKANNPWFEQDIKLTRYARQASLDFARQYPHLTAAQNLQLVEDDVRTTFPEKFNNALDDSVKNIQNATIMNGGKNSGNMINNRSSSFSEFTFEQLPQEEQERVERMIRQKAGSFKSKAEYMKQYNDHYKSNKK